MKLKYDSWSKITPKVMNRLQLANLSGDENERSLRIAAILAGITQKELENLPFSEYFEILQQADFIKDCPEVKVKPEYVLNGHEYVLKLQAERITTSQFIDYQTVAKQTTDAECRILSICLIPKGHEYGDGYDFKEVEHDIETALSYPDFIALKVFFCSYSEEYLDSSRLFLAKQMTRQIPWTSPMRKLKGILAYRQLRKALARSGAGL